jgi:quercetin dioxygenase-like cupin family protein
VIDIRKIKPSFTDERGDITKILDEGVAVYSVLIITCKKGAVRANHYHKEDSHYAYLLSGEMEYTEMPMGVPGAKKESVTLVPGDLVFTKPQTAHAMRFTQDSVFLALATKPRSHDQYEADTVRIKLVE